VRFVIHLGQAQEECVFAISAKAFAETLAKLDLTSLAVRSSLD